MGGAMSHPYLKGFDHDELPLDPNLNFEQIEPHLSAVTSFWAAGRLEELVDYVKKLIDQQIYDIRLMSFYLYSLWEVDAFDCSMNQALEALHHLIKQEDEVWFIKEQEENDKHAPDRLDESTRKQLKASLNLFFNRVVQTLERFADQTENEEPTPCEIIETTEQLADLLDQRFQFTDMVPLVQQISSYFNDPCKKALQAAEQEAIQAEELNHETTDDETPDHTEAHHNTLENAEEYTQGADGDSPINPDQADENAQTLIKEQTIHKPISPYSLPMQQLLNKLQIFEILMANTDIYKAAIVFESIQKELQAFNPLHYLPELFSDYAKTHALYATDLYELMHQHDNAQSQALKDYFAIDPEGFLQLEIDDETLEQEHDDPYAFHGE
jgi:hypothetical protein